MKLTISQAALLGVMAAITTLTVMTAYGGQLMHMSMGCEGIGEFYTGQGFYEDVSDYRNILYNRINWSFAANKRLDDKLINLYAPKDLTPDNNFDCKSISNGIMCLAKQYNVTCRFTTMFRWSEMYVGLIGHLGIECYDEGFNDWREMY